MNRFFEKIKNGETAIGTHVQMGSPMIMDIMGRVGFDAVWIDTEHTAIDKDNLLNHIISLSGHGTAAIVRIPWNDAVLAKPVLEMGPDGIIFPYVRSADDVDRAMKSCIYPPYGCRGFGPIRANNYGMMTNDEYFNYYIENTMRIAQIEHVDAVECIDEILKVQYLSAIVLGPNDLSGSLGLLGRQEHPDVQACFDKVAEAANKAGIPWGVSTGYNLGSGGGGLQKWIDRGAKFLFIGSDVSYVAGGAAQTYSEVSQLVRG
jgi:2-keto-3-deoxy-L-rhamnonate aldolase RhmA